MTGPIILLTFSASMCVWVCVRGLCCLRYLTRKLINIEMTSGRVQCFTSGERQEGGKEAGEWRIEEWQCTRRGGREKRKKERWDCDRERRRRECGDKEWKHKKRERQRVGRQRWRQQIRESDDRQRWQKRRRGRRQDKTGRSRGKARASKSKAVIGQLYRQESALCNY